MITANGAICVVSWWSSEFVGGALGSDDEGIVAGEDIC